MSKFTAKSVCILGRQSQLGLAELESLYGTDHVRALDGHAMLDIAAEEINFKRLGGTIKTARFLTTLPRTDWKSISKFLIDKVPAYVEPLPEGKFTLGISAYGLTVKSNDINKTNLQIKKIIKASGRPVRIVPNKTPELNSAQVLHNNLTRRGAWELILVRDGGQVIVAQTLFVQDIEAYAARDQARPARDARVGMLPPKLAQIIINLAAGPIERKLQAGATSGGGAADPARRQASRARIRVLDPFCGSGVILQEAMLMGYSVIGTDIEPRMVDYAAKNLQWLVKKNPSIETQADIEIGDATSFKWPGFSTIASEVFLGRALTHLPTETELKQIVSDANTITKKFLSNISDQLKPSQRMCLAVPAWRKPDDGFIHLPLIDHLTEMGYNYLDFKHVRRQELIYYRQDQTVARQLIILEKR